MNNIIDIYEKIIKESSSDDLFNGFERDSFGLYKDCLPESIAGEDNVYLRIDKQNDGQFEASFNFNAVPLAKFKAEDEVVALQGLMNEVRIVLRKLQIAFENGL